MAADPSARRDPVGGLIVAGAALLFGTIVVIGRFVAPRVPVPVLLSIRFTVAAALQAAVLAALGQRFRPARGEGWRIVALGAVGYGVEAGFFFAALGRGTAATVTLLFYTYPVWVALLSVILGLGVPRLLVAGALVAAVTGAGLVIVSSGGLDITGVGVVFALTSAVVISLYVVGLSAFVPRTPALPTALWGSVGAAATLAAFGFVTGTARLPEGAREWVPILSMGVLTAASLTLLVVGIRRVGPVRSSIIASLEPVFAAVLAFLFLGELLRPGAFAGGALILAGAVAATLARAPERDVGLP